MSATVKDLLMSAEYIFSAGNPNVVLCERGFVPSKIRIRGICST